MPSRSRPRRHLLVWTTLVAFAATSGCATLLPAPSPSETLRAELGTVGVVAARSAPETTLRIPSRGPAAGAARGAGRGALVTVRTGFQAAAGTAGSGEAGALVALLAVAAGIALMPVGAVVGAIHGAAVAQPAAHVDAAEAVVRRVLATPGIHERLRDGVAETARSRIARPRVVVPVVLGEAAGYTSLANEGIDTVLEVSVSHLAVSGEWKVDPPLEVRLTVQARLVRVSDGAVLHTFAPTSWSRRRSFVEWAWHDAEPLRQEVDRGLGALAEAVVEELFLLYVPPAPPGGAGSG